MIARLRERVGGSVLVEPVVLALAVTLFVVQDLAISRISPDGDWAWLRSATFFVTTPLFVAVALHFRRFLGAWLIALGIALNFIPMAAHGGNMPIAYELVRDTGEFPSITEEQIGQQVENSKDVLLWREDIRVEPLSDNIVFSLPGYGTNIYSPGDVVIAIGVIIAALEAIGLAFGFSWSRFFVWLRSRDRSPAN